MEYQSLLHKKLHGGGFIFTAETTPPDASNKNVLLEKTKLFAQTLEKYLNVLIDFTSWIENSMKNSKDDVSAACNDYLRVLGLIAVGYSWLKVLDISFKEIKNNKKFFMDKIETAQFYFDRILPRIDSHYNSGTSGSKNIMNFNFN